MLVGMMSTMRGHDGSFNLLYFTLKCINDPIEGSHSLENVSDDLLLGGNLVLGLLPALCHGRHHVMDVPLADRCVQVPGVWFLGHGF